MDTSPIALRFKTNSRPYLFFQFTLSVYNVLLFDKDYVSEPSSKIDLPPGLDLKGYNFLMSLFNQSVDDTNSFTSLSFIQVISLMSVVDQIAKALLTEEDDKLKSKVLAKFSDIQKDWDNDFFKSAQYVFSSFKDKYKDFPKFNYLMQIISGQ